MKAIDAVIRKRMETYSGNVDFSLMSGGSDGVFAGKIELAYNYKVDGEVTVCDQSGIHAYEITFEGCGTTEK